MARYEEDYIVELTIENTELQQKVERLERNYDALSKLYNQQLEVKTQLFDKLDKVWAALEMTASHEEIVHAIEEIMEEV